VVISLIPDITRSNNRSAEGEARGVQRWRYTIPVGGDVGGDLRVTRPEEIGYDGPLSIEREDPRFRATPDARKEGLLRAKEYLEGIIR
jgi:hypothetical protein